MTDLAKELRDSANAAYIAHCPTDIVAILRRAADELDRRAALDVPARELDGALQAPEYLSKHIDIKPHHYSEWAAVLEKEGHKFHASDTVFSFLVRLLRTQPAVTEAMEDYITHHYDWVMACTISRDAAASQDDRDYWQHQINTLSKLQASQAQRTGEK